VYLGRFGGYFTGNISGQLEGEKSEAQIDYESKKLMSRLHRCDKYVKYRARQPQTAKDREQRWPDNLEEAFFRGTMILRSIFGTAVAYCLRFGSISTYGSTKTYE
jgi:hypothetical protein